mmetsp:Transcript_13127/g.35947  ORF Transcript_13127/g.35947 Transcript_13127/m.35947 type:complete len:258 (+) Transcript_13127:525-1298(+)
MRPLEAALPPAFAPSSSLPPFSSSEPSPESSCSKAASTSGRLFFFGFFFVFFRASCSAFSCANLLSWVAFFAACSSALLRSSNSYLACWTFSSGTAFFSKGSMTSSLAMTGPRRWMPIVPLLEDDDDFDPLLSTDSKKEESLTSLSCSRCFSSCSCSFRFWLAAMPEPVDPSRGGEAGLQISCPSDPVGCAPSGPMPNFRIFSMFLATGSLHPIFSMTSSTSGFFSFGRMYFVSSRLIAEVATLPRITRDKPNDVCL